MNWVKLDAERFSDWKEQNINGVVVEVAASPYDIPEAVGGGCVETTPSLFMVEFFYPTQEQTRKVQAAPHIEVLVGLNSHRIYSIQTDLKALGAFSGAKPKPGTRFRVEKEIIQAIDGVSVAQNDRYADRYKLAKLIIASNRDRLFENIPEKVHGGASFSI